MPPTIQPASGASRDAMIAKHGLTLVQSVVLGRPYVSLVRDQAGTTLILKTHHINPKERGLIAAAKQLQGQLSFRVPAIVHEGDGYVLLEYIDAPMLKSQFEARPDWCIEASARIAADYQKVLAAAEPGDPTEGSSWQREKLQAWYRPLIDAGLGTEQERVRLEAALARIERNGKLQYGWAHGNIHGEHVLVGEGDALFLVDLDARPRLGGATYDVLRAIDFYLLDMADNAGAAARAERWLEQYVPSDVREDASVLFGLRCVGICWDILADNARPDMPRREEKLAMLRSFISRAAAAA